MTIPVERYHKNIERSIKKHIKENFVVPNSLTSNVNYGDTEFESTGLDKWIAFTFLSAGAGKKGSTLLQADVYTRIRGKISGGDRYGTECERLMRLLHMAMHVDSIQLYNFETDPSSPVLLPGKSVMVQNSNGTFREPNEVRVWSIEDGVARRTITWRLRLPTDASMSFTIYRD
jgi:hypothetical protein